MIVGKLSPSRLRQAVLAHTGAARPDVLLGPEIGEDAAVIDFGDEVCVIASDPITGSFTGVGRLAVNVAANDVAATGASPVGLQVVLLWPPRDNVDDDLARVMEEISVAAQELGIAVLGGHTEVTSRVDEGVVIATCIGRAPRDKYVPSGGGRPGDTLLLVRSAGLEGTGILASDHAGRLAALPPETVQRAQAFMDELSVVAPALAARDAGVSAMHDVTEGGVIGALWEMAHASGLGADVRKADIPVRPETEAICRELSIDPLALLGSGALLIAASDANKVKQSLAAQGWHEVTAIGRLTDAHRSVRLIGEDGSVTDVDTCPTDELWRFLAESENDDAGSDPRS